MELARDTAFVWKLLLSEISIFPKDVCAPLGRSPGAPSVKQRLAEKKSAYLASFIFQRRTIKLFISDS